MAISLTLPYRTFVSTMEEQTKKILSSVLVMGAIGGGFYLFKRGSKLLSGAKMNFALVGFRILKMTLTDVQFVVKLRTITSLT